MVKRGFWHRCEYAETLFNLHILLGIYIKFVELQNEDETTPGGTSMM